MKILAIDSSGMVASVAIAQDDNLLAEYTVNYKKTHSQTLMPMLNEIVKMTELDLESIDAIAVAAGPGSFTGLRIGSATAKGLGLALDKPLIAIPTIDGLAYNLWGTSEMICPMIDARRNQVYTGLYEFQQENLTAILEQTSMDVDDVIALLNEKNQPVILLGDGSAVYEEKLKNGLRVPWRLAPAHKNRQSAASLAALGMRYLKEEKTENARDHKPDYLRLSQAEREREKRQQDEKKKLCIRNMTIKDCPAVAAIEVECFSRPWSEQAFTDSLKLEHTLYLTAEKNGQIVGYCGVQQSFNEGEITNVAVAPSCRQQGIGLQMLQELLRQGQERGIDAFTLEVRMSNASALQLYHKLGFENQGIRKRFYDRPIEDAVIMWKRR